MDPEKGKTLTPDLQPVQIRNPISTKAANLRTNLVGGLHENVAWNKNRGAEGVHIFEIGNVFHVNNDTYSENLMLGMVMTGLVGEKHWKEKSKEASFYHLKGTCEALLTHLRYGSYSFQEKNHPHFKKGSALALLFKGEEIGYLGAVNQNVLDAYALKENTWASEINLSLLFEKQPQAFKYSAVVKYPSVNRDVSFIGDKSVSFEEIREVVESLSLSYLEKFVLYDRFTGSSIPEGKVSLSFRFVFRRPDRTLQADEVDVLLEKIIGTLGTRFHFQLREGGKIDK
jgi:phenylalanyl-tRNA synthetase beta chain